MSKRKADLPIMLGKNLRKGIVAYRNEKMGGYDLAVLWLKREYPTGAEYSMDDVDNQGSWFPSMHVAYLDDNGQWDGELSNDDRVVAWMPLPAPWSGE